MRVVLVFVLLLLLSGCGYKPSSKFARSVVGEKVSTSVVISAQDPENTVIIKDAVDLAIVEVFRASLVDKAYATTHLSMSISPPTYQALQFDADGFVIAYRATILLTIFRDSKESKKSYISVGTYDFSVVPNAVITDQERFDAIRYGSVKAIRSFIAQVSAEGSRIKE